MDYVDEANEYAVAAAKLAGKYEFLIAMQEDIQRIFMQDEEAEYASYIAQMEGERYEGQTIGEPRTPAKAAETVDKEAFEEERRA